LLQFTAIHAHGWPGDARTIVVILLYFFDAWWVGVFAGVFWKNVVLSVVILW